MSTFQPYFSTYLGCGIATKICERGTERHKITVSTFTKILVFFLYLDVKAKISFYDRTNSVQLAVLITTFEEY